MPQKIRLWGITAQNTLKEIASSEINLEERLENWLESDISMLDPNLMVIGRQVRTDFGGEIDLLCLDSSGAIVVVELKKGRTPREVTAQALDYASWVKDLSYQQAENLAEAYLKKPLDEAFSEKFDLELPESFGHRSLIVAEVMDSSTERIVRYLSDFGVPVNIATVQHSQSEDGKEVLAQVFLIEPEEAETRVSSASRRRPSVSAREMATLAEQSGVGELYEHLGRTAAGTFSSTFPRATSRGFNYGLDGRKLMLFVIDLDASGSEMGIKFRLNGIRAMNIFGLSEHRIREFLPCRFEEMDATELRGKSQDEIDHWLGYKGFFQTRSDIDRFLSLFAETVV